MAVLIKTRRISVVRSNPETFDLRNRIQAVGTISAASLGYVDTFVSACKAAGLWDNLIDVGLFVGDQLEAALVKLKYPIGGLSSLENVGFVAGDYNETGANGGLQGDGVGKYLKTGVNQNAAGLRGLAFYNRTAVNNVAVRTMIGMGALDNIALTVLRHTATADQFYFGGTAASKLQDNSVGFYAGMYDSADGNVERRLYLAGNEIAANLAAAPAAFSPNQIYVFARNEVPAAGEFWSGRGSFYAITKKLSAGDVMNLSAAVQALQTSLNRNV